jgi:hypothetical protein
MATNRSLSAAIAGTLFCWRKAKRSARMHENGSRLEKQG